MNEQSAGELNPPPLSAKKKTEIVIADALQSVRDQWRDLLSHARDLRIIGEAQGAHETLDLVQEHHPDVLLCNLAMPEIEAVRGLLRLSCSGTHLILWVEELRKDSFARAMRLGCSGVIARGTLSNQVARCVRAVASGDTWVDPQIAAMIARRFAGKGHGSPRGRQARHRALSQREREIIDLVAQGYKNVGIAEKLSIQERTVKNHLHNIFDKLGVSDRLELALYAVHNG